MVEGIQREVPYIVIILAGGHHANGLFVRGLCQITLDRYVNTFSSRVIRAWCVNVKWRGGEDAISLNFIRFIKNLYEIHNRIAMFRYCCSINKSTEQINNSKRQHSCCVTSRYEESLVDILHTL